MFEIDQYERRRHKDSPAQSELAYLPTDNIAKISLLFWGEHCVECAAPACYSTCDLYEARPDTRCRRFTFGIYRNLNFRSLRGYGAEVYFKKWGVLGTMGNTSMVPRRRLMFQERLIALVAPFINAVGPLISRVTKDPRWIYPTFGLSRRFCNWLHQRNTARVKPDAFLLEVYNPGAESIRMQLGMGHPPDAQAQLTGTVQILPRFRTTLIIPSGYSSHVFEHRLFQGITDSGRPFGISLTPEADTSPHLVFLTADFVTYANTKATDKSRPAIKCVVWDLDNTLWDGTLAENDDVILKPAIKELLDALDQRGILLSIASKNDYQSAWERVQALGLSEYFLVPQITWSPKSESIKTIAKQLNIGLDTLAFIDDNPFELTEVAAAVPEVSCIDARNVRDILQNQRFQGGKTADTKNRRRYYQEAIARDAKQAEFGNEYLTFLTHCDIQLEVKGYHNEEFERVAELVQRTNQLNFSGRKYDRNELGELLGDPTLEKYTLSCSDKFGSYGLVGFGLARHSSQEIEIQDFRLSCRVQGKLIEDAFFSHLESHHNPMRALRLRVNFRETARNQPARQALDAAGFRKLEQEDAYVREIRLSTAEEHHVVRVKCMAPCLTEIAQV